MENNLKIETLILFKNLQIEALKADLTISSIASNMKVSEKYLISRIKGKSEPSLDFVLCYAAAINVDISVTLSYRTKSNLRRKFERWLASLKKKRNETNI